MARQTREETREQTRERILDSARCAFARSGFAGASVDFISEAAGYSKGAFYSNFESKEDAFLVLLKRYLHDEIARGRAAIAGDSTDVALDSFVEIYALDEEDQDWCLLSVEFALHAARSEAFGATFAEVNRRYYKQVAETLTQLAAMTGGRTANAYLSATKFIAFRRGLALDRASNVPSLSNQDVRQSLKSFLMKVLNLETSSRF
jgi:AcrR family transcriptional regulator